MQYYGNVTGSNNVGPQGTFTGLDQFNLLLPRALAGKGKVELTVTANGKVSNTVNLTIK